MGSVVETLSPPSILGLRTQVRPVRRSVLSLRQVAPDFSAVRGLTGYAVLLTTPPLTYQGTERLSGKVGIKKKIRIQPRGCNTNFSHFDGVVTHESIF